MRIGYLGVGTIAGCMIEGFCGLGTEHDFYLSPRNAAKSAALSAKYANCIVCDSNQHVVDMADTVIVSMLADTCVETLKGLRFRRDQWIINLVATIPPEDILGAVGEVGDFAHIVPLPFIKHRLGPISAYPENDALRELLSPLGSVVFARSMDEIRAMQAITALMSPFYEMLHQLAIFAEGEGMPRAEAIAFISTFFASLGQRPLEGDFRHHALDMTPGGLNELTLKRLGQSGAISAWAEVMTEVMGRIKKN